MREIYIKMICLIQTFYLLIINEILKYAVLNNIKSSETII